MNLCAGHIFLTNIKGIYDPEEKRTLIGNSFLEVQANYFEEHKLERRYWDNKKPTEDKLNNWQSEIHAAKLLADIFLHFSDKKLLYRKTTHSVELTDWLIENKPSMFDELKSLLENLYRP